MSASALTHGTADATRHASSTDPSAEPLVSIVIPCFNEDAAIGDTLEQIRQSIDADDLRFEVIVVDDGSTDASRRIVEEKAAADERLQLVHHETNRGYGAALKTGIRRARGDKVVILDSDGQHDPRSVSTIVAQLGTYDMVIGTRSADSHHVRSRTLGKRLIRWVGEYLVEQPLPDYNSGFRGFDRQLMLGMLHIMPNGFSFSTTSTLAFLKEGFAIGSVPIAVAARSGRKSNVKFVKDGTKTILLIFRIIMLFNPLKVFFPASVLFSALGMAWGIFGYLAYARFATSAAVVVTFGMLLFFFGLIADQLAILNRRRS